MRLLLTILAMVLASQISVATPYRLDCFRQIANALAFQIPDSMRRPYTDIDSVAVYHGQNVYVRCDGFAEVSQIGYRLFSQAVRDANMGVPVFDFLERYLLELDLSIGEKNAALRMDVDGVVVTQGSLQMLRQLTPQTSLSLRVEEIPRKMYRLHCSFNGKTIQVTIPADSQLLFGGNIIELEQLFMSGVRRMMTLSGEDLIAEWQSEAVKSGDDMLVVEGGTYRIDAIRGDIYLTKRRGRRQLLMDAKSPMRSISNLMLTGAGQQDVPLHVDFHVYGNKRNTMEVTLQQYIAYCKAEGCKLYFGTKTLTDSVLTGTLFAYNEKYAYTHMLSVTVPLSVISDGTGTISGHAYVYIPLHDITEKYISPRK